jgi:hypothetical protein
MVAAVISAFIVFVTGQAADSFRARLAQIAQRPIGGAEWWGKVERELDRAADPASDLPVDKKQSVTPA